MNLLIRTSHLERKTFLINFNKIYYFILILIINEINVI